MQEQLTNFAIALQKCSGEEKLNVQKSWILAFYELSKYLESLPAGKKIIFIDELPWMDTPKSRFIPALENFWNSWASVRDDVKLIVCGSATSWMMNNLIRSRGGLHNRLSFQLVLEPFTLNECELYFKAKGFSYSRKQIAESYMAIGGIPYYMSMMDRSLSLSQNIDKLFFSEYAPLKNEFSALYEALFKNAAPHILVVTALAGKSKATKRQSRDTLYQLTDFYTLFYFKFIQNNHFHDDHFWTASLNSPAHNTWAGLSFEMLCLLHLKQIKTALGIAGVHTLAGPWQSTSEVGGTQIDLVIDRKDDTINLCEVKYSRDEFEIDAEYENKLTNKVSVFSRETGTKKSIILTMLTTCGLKQNSHSGVVQKEVVLETCLGNERGVNPHSIQIFLYLSESKFSYK